MMEHKRVLRRIIQATPKLVGENHMPKPGKVIAVATSKGGAGKTTVSGNLADTLAIAGYSVALVDLDPNHNLGRWIAKAKKHGQPAFENIPLEIVDSEEEIVGTIRRLKAEHD